MLEARSISHSFGGVRAVDDVSVTVTQGKIVGLIGTNGAGKTTLFNIVSGFIRAAKGTVTLDGADITRSKPSEIAELGLLRTFQTPIGFPKLTVFENMLVFSPEEKARRRSFFPSAEVEAAVADRAMAILGGVGLAAKRNLWAQDLAAPELKLLEFARAMMAKPRLSLLDEPAAGVNPALMENIAGRIRAMRDDGVTFLVVDHNLKFICSICDEIYAMADGRVIAHGTPEAVINEPSVIELYIGKPAEPVTA